MNNDNFNSYNNNNQNNQQGYNPYGYNYNYGYNYGGYNPGNVNKPNKEKKNGGRVFALVLVGAILGAAIGGGGVGLYLTSTGTPVSSFTSAQQNYIDKAVSNSVASALNASGSKNTVELSSATSVEYSADIQSVAKSVMPSVVGVKTVEPSRQTFFGDSGSSTSTGTGIIVSSDGLILTNQHVVSDNPSSVTVTLMDGTEHEAKVLFADSSMDLAVIKIEATGLTAASLGDSDNISIGQVAIAIGNPYGLEYQRSVTAGIVSALNRSILLSQTQISENLIQTDAAINSGNSGGPLLNEKGEVIGINSYKLSDGEGMGFAIPVNAAKPIVNQIIQTGSFTQAQIGATFIDKEILTYYDFNGLKLDSGLYVYNIDQTSDAYSKGLKSGDVVTKVNGTEVNTILELKQLLYGHAPGDTITLTVVRDGNASDMSVKLSEATSS